MAGIDDLDADRGRIEVALALPDADAGMPCASRFRHELHDRAVFLDDIMSGDLGLGVAQQVDRALRGRHAGIMQDEAIGSRETAPLAVIGRGQERLDERAVGERDFCHGARRSEDEASAS